MQVPSVVHPKSNPAMLTPANLASPVDVVVGVADVVVVDDVVVECVLDVDVTDVTDVEEWTLVVEVVRVVPELAVPGRHCEYHGLEYVQTYPLIQVVAPSQSSPPPKNVSEHPLQLAQHTLAPSSRLSSDGARKQQGEGCKFHTWFQAKSDLKKKIFGGSKML